MLFIEDTKHILSKKHRKPNLMRGSLWDPHRSIVSVWGNSGIMQA